MRKENQIAMTIRLPEELYRKILNKSKEEKRSINNLIIVHLQESLKE